MNGSYRMKDHILTRTYLYRYSDSSMWVRQAVSNDKMTDRFGPKGVVFKTELSIEEGSEQPYKLKVEVWKKKEM